MYSILHKKLIWMVVVWFAILQALSPLVHAHIEADTSAQGAGIHMHVDEIVQINDQEHVKSQSSNAHTIGIQQALKKNVDKLSISLFVVIFILVIFLVVLLCHQALNFLSIIPFYLRPHSRPRAPPVLLK